VLPRRTLRLLAAAAAVSAVAAASIAEPSSATITTFVLPSKNIGCAYLAPDRYVKEASLRCDILSGLNPTPRAADKACELDLTGLSLGSRRRGTVTCAGDTAFDPRARVLRYGARWRGGPFTCTSRVTGLTCTSRAGHGIFLSRERWRVW
jgi:hypothetical protein